MSILSIENLHANVGETEILRGINLKIEPGEVHAVMGPNGSGKSTLSYVLAGRDGYSVTGGSVEFKDKDLLELEADERANEGVFLAFQYPVEVPEKPTFTGRLSISSLIFRSFAFDLTNLRNSIASASSLPSYRNRELYASRKNVIPVTPGTSTGY